MALKSKKLSNSTTFLQYLRNLSCFPLMQIKAHEGNSLKEGRDLTFEEEQKESLYLCLVI